MWFVVLIVAALARDVPFEPPTIPTPSDPGQDSSPYESRLLVPDLKGSEGSFDLEALAFVKTRLTITADLSSLGQVTPTIKRPFCAMSQRIPVGGWSLGTAPSSRSAG